MQKRGLLVAVGGLLTFVLAAGTWFSPIPYVVRLPGPTVDVLGTADGADVITVTGAPTSVSAGRLLLTTVRVETTTDLAGALRAWTDDRSAVIPRTAIFPGGQSVEQVQQSVQAAFAESESTAIAVALAELGRPAGARVSVGLDEIGGPSAGLMIMLGVVDELTPADLTGGHVIAGTGEISRDGVVGPIGGIPQKLHAAQSAGAEYFLVPDGNCAEAVRAGVHGLTLARVATAGDALAALRAIAAGQPPTAC
jgi:PDZ domain-containing protein